MLQADASGLDPCGGQVHDNQYLIGTHRGEDSSSDGEVLEIPYVRHTFLDSCPPLRSRRRAAPRSRSVVVAGTCDRYAAEVHAMMFKVQPVQTLRPTQTISAASTPSFSSSPVACVAASMDASTAEDASGGVDTSSETERTLHGGGLLQSLQSGAAEDAGFSEAEDSDLEQVKVAVDEPIESVLARIPYDEEGRPTSLGTLGHAVGHCRPCAFLGSEQRPCQNGARCPFCHLPHPTKRRIRVGRRKRLEMRAAVAAAVAEAGNDGIDPPPRYLPISWPTPAATETLKRAGFS